MQQRKQLLDARRSRTQHSERALKAQIRDLNQRILQTPAYDYNDPSYTRVKFLRYADDVMIGVIGPKTLAEQIREEIAAFLQRRLETRTQSRKDANHAPANENMRTFWDTSSRQPARAFEDETCRRKGSPHNVVQTVKTTSGNIKLLVPLKELSEKAEKVHGQWSTSQQCRLSSTSP